MKTRFLADADLNKAILNGTVRREPSIDFLSADAAGLRGMSDSEVLRLHAVSKGFLSRMMWGPCPSTSVSSGVTAVRAPECF